MAAPIAATGGLSNFRVTAVCQLILILFRTELSILLGVPQDTICLHYLTDYMSVTMKGRDVMVNAYVTSHFLTSQVPETVYYIPNFITEDEERYLFDKVYDAPKPKWVQLSHRRLQNWGTVRRISTSTQRDKEW